MYIHILEGSLFLSIFSLGLFLGAGVRPLLMPAMKREPALIGPILTAMFSRYNLLALVLSATCLVLELMHPASISRLLLAGSLTLVLAFKVPFDKVVQRRERSGQVRGKGDDGEQLDRLHKVVEGATAVILVLSLASFIMTLIPAPGL